MKLRIKTIKSLLLLSSLLVLTINPIFAYSQETISHCQSYDLLILSPDKYTDQLNKLKNHKESVGIKTIIVSLTEVYDQMFWKGRDNPEKIKYFIKEAFDTWHISYVLLIGNFQDYLLIIHKKYAKYQMLL